MQKVIEFKKKNFWTSSIDIQELNIKVAECNADGWRVLSLTPNTAGFGGIISYTILLEK